MRGDTEKIKAMKEMEEFKISFELQSRQMQNILEGKRIDVEQKKLDSEKKLLKMKLKHDSDKEETGQKSSIITAALAQGFAFNEIKGLVDLVD
ncbi:hypothetical protein BG000_011221 [Podila horticola]|nr:hypothetical protein BG000_011221 [Podila horticola]